MGPSPVVTGLSPKEASAGTRITIRGENLGVSQQDLLGVLILGYDCLLTVEWKSSTKLTALCPGGAKDGGRGDIIVATRSGGLGTCNVQLRVFKEPIGPLKEVASWTNEKFYPRKIQNRLSPGAAGRDMAEHEDALGLSVEGSDQRLSDTQLAKLFPGKSGDIASDNFDPAYYLLENHHGTTFEDLRAGLGFLRRKVDGENESQLSFIKANVNSIMDQLDTLKGIKKRYEIDNVEMGGGRDPTAKVESTIAQAKREADKMFVDVLGRKDSADATRNALNVMNRFRFLFNLPAAIEANLAKGDFDRIIDECDRAKSLYGDSDSEIFKMYLTEIEKGLDLLKSRLRDKLQEPTLIIEEQKKTIANLVQLNVSGDPAWECLNIQYRYVLNMLDECRDKHVSKNANSIQAFPTEQNVLFSSANDSDQATEMPYRVVFVQEITDKLAEAFPSLWKLGQSYFKGDLVVSPDPGKSPVFKEMILGAIRYFSSMVRAAIIPQTLPEGEETEYGQWGDVEGAATASPWLPSCLRHVRKSYSSFIDLDLPSQALDIIKKLSTDLRIQCLQVIFQTVIDQVHLLHEKETWRIETSDEYGSITRIPATFESLVLQSVQLIKEALLSTDRREEDILSYQNAHSDLELLIQNVLSSFAFTLENAAVESYASLTNIPSETTRMLLCRNNCRYTMSHILPKIQKSFQEVGQLSLEKPVAEACKCYLVLDGKLFEAYLELRCDPIVSAIETNMYVGKFDWARCPRPTDARDYVKAILHDVIRVHAEVGSVSALAGEGRERHEALERVAAAAAEEVNRLFCCISRMNSNGCIQAWVDIHCLRDSLKPYLTEAAMAFLTDAAKPLYDLERPGDKEVIQSCIGEFNKRMKFHLAALGVEKKRA